MELIKKNIKWITLGACVLAIIGLFLPMMTISLEWFGQTMSESIVFIEHDGAIVFATIVVAAVFVILNKDVISIAPLLVGCGITAYDSFNAASKFDEITALSSNFKIGFGIGFYLTVIGLALALITILYNQFAIKKLTVSEVFQSVLKRNSYYNQPMQSQGQVVYAQSFGNVNNENNGYNGMSNNQGGYDSINQQPVVQPNYNVGYQQPMQNNYNNDFNISNNSVSQQVGMPTSAVNNDIFNQTPIAQSSPVMEQSVMNNVQPTAPVQDFSSSATIMCPQCGTTLNSGMQFCNQCGSKLN